LPEAIVETNEWAPVHLRHRGALHLRFRRRVSDRDQSIFMIESAWPLRSDPADRFGFLGAATWASSCCSPNLRRDLAVEQGHWLSRWRHAPLQEWARRTYVRIRCLQFDHMIGRQFPQKQGAERSATPTGAALEMLRQIRSAVKICCAKARVSSEHKPARWQMVPPQLSGN
jgi:hypothetical protein